MIRWIKEHFPNQRRLIQLYTALLYNAYVKGFVKGDIYTGQLKMLCVPGLNCYSCPGAVGVCPLGALQNAVAASGNKAPFYAVGILLIYGLFLGRSICGFLCPVGLLQELLHKLPTPKITKGRFTRLLTYLKYSVLAFFVILVPFLLSFQHLPTPAFCKYICPAGTAEGAIGLLSNPVNADKFSMLGMLFTQKVLILLIIVGVCIFIYRAFCRFLCPLGAIYGLFSRFALIGVKVDMPKCVDCARCVHTCKMDIRHVGDHECIHCGECIDVCPTKAITFKAGLITLCGHKDSPTHFSAGGISISNTKRKIIWAVAIILLLGIMWFVNFEAASPRTVADNDLQTPLQTNDQIPADCIGYEVGDYAPEFSAPIYASDDCFVLSEHRGKKVVVNFWATWCAPCCSELPYFDAIHRAYRDQVAVVALHSDLVTDDVELYLSKFDYEMTFAHDATGSIISSFGGSTMLPHTVIINEDGKVMYNATGSLTYEEILALLNLSPTET